MTTCCPGSPPTSRSTPRPAPTRSAISSASLDKVGGLRRDEVLPAHEYRFVDLPGRVKALKSHHQARFDEVICRPSGPGDTTTWGHRRPHDVEPPVGRDQGWMRRAAVGRDPGPPGTWRGWAWCARRSENRPTGGWSTPPRGRKWSRRRGGREQVTIIATVFLAAVVPDGLLRAGLRLAGRPARQPRSLSRPGLGYRGGCGRHPLRPGSPVGLGRRTPGATRTGTIAACPTGTSPTSGRSWPRPGPDAPALAPGRTSGVTWARARPASRRRGRRPAGRRPGPAGQGGAVPVQRAGVPGVALRGVQSGHGPGEHQLPLHRDGVGLPVGQRRRRGGGVPRLLRRAGRGGARPPPGGPRSGCGSTTAAVPCPRWADALRGRGRRPAAGT